MGEESGRRVEKVLRGEPVEVVPGAGEAVRVELGVGDGLNLTRKQSKFLAGVAAGSGMKEAALEAGYAPGVSPEGAIVPSLRRRFRKLLEQRIPIEKLATRLSEGLDAEETRHFSFEGKVCDERQVADLSERRRYLEAAAKLMGLEPDKKPSSGGGQTTVVLASWMGRKE